MRRDQCRSCGAAIVWLMTTAGRRMCVDAASVADNARVFDPKAGQLAHCERRRNAAGGAKPGRGGAKREKGKRMQQIAMFPLSVEERLEKGDQLSLKIEEVERLEEQKESTAGQFNEAIKKAKAEIKRMAKEIRERQAEREATDEEAPSTTPAKPNGSGESL